MFEKFVVYKRAYGRQCNFPFVRITDRLFCFNGNSLTNHLEGFDFAELYYDKDNNKIALKLLVKRTEHSFKITKRTGNATMYARTFLNAFDIEDRGRFRMKLEDGLLVLTKIKEQTQQQPKEG